MARFVYSFMVITFCLGLIFMNIQLIDLMVGHKDEVTNMVIQKESAIYMAMSFGYHTIIYTLALLMPFLCVSGLYHILVSGKHLFDVELNKDV